MAYAPTLTTYLNADPCPRVEVFFEELDPAAVTVTVYRSAAGREYRMRGAVNAPTGGTFTRIDFECPFNVPVTYRAEMFDAAGLSLGFTDQGVMGAVFGDDDLPEDDVFTELFPGGPIGYGLVSAHTWLHNPLDPHGAVKVSLAATTGRSLSRPVPGEVSYPRGRSVGVVLAEPRQGVRGLRFDVRVSDTESADKVQNLIGSYSNITVPIVCIRLGGDETRLRVPKPLFLGVMDIAEVDIDVVWGGGDTRQEMVGDEVAPPIPGLFIPLLTAADINVSFATAAAVNSAHSTAYEVNRRYDLAGAASA